MPALRIIPKRAPNAFGPEGDQHIMLIESFRPAPAGPPDRKSWMWLLLAGALVSAGTTAAQTVRVDTTPTRAIKFDPDQALGSSMDILPASVIDKVYSEPILKESLSAGWGPITYRQDNELTIAAWHWNSNGTWSDAGHQRRD